MTNGQAFLKKEESIKNIAESINIFLGVKKKPIKKANKSLKHLVTTVGGCNYYVQKIGKEYFLNGLINNAYVFSSKSELGYVRGTFPKHKLKSIDL